MNRRDFIAAALAAPALVLPAAGCTGTTTSIRRRGRLGASTACLAGFSLLEAGLERVRRALDGLAFLEGRTAVVHPGWPEEGRTYREIWLSMVDTFRALGEYASERDIVIGLETMQPASVDDYSDLIFDIDHPAVGATIDTGHIRGSTDIGLPPDERHTGEGTERFNDVLNHLVEGLGDRVVHVHLTDVQGSDWRDHRMAGSGIVDFRRFFNTLDHSGYDGLYVFELEEEDQIAALRTSAAHVEGWLGR